MSFRPCMGAAEAAENLRVWPSFTDRILLPCHQINKRFYAGPESGANGPAGMFLLARFDVACAESGATAPLLSGLSRNMSVGVGNDHKVMNAKVACLIWRAVVDGHRQGDFALRLQGRPGRDGLILSGITQRLT